MKNLMTLAVLVAAVQLAGCRASAPLTSTCQTQPSSFLTGQDGKPSAAIFPCYRADGVMTYQARTLTPDEVKAVTTALAPAAAPKVDPAVGSADPCSAKQGLDYRICRENQQKKPKPFKPVDEFKVKAAALQSELDAAKAALEKKAAVAKKVAEDKAAAEKLQAEAAK